MPSCANDANGAVYLPQLLYLHRAQKSRLHTCPAPDGEVNYCWRCEHCSDVTNQQLQSEHTPPGLHFLRWLKQPWLGDLIQVNNPEDRRPLTSKTNGEEKITVSLHLTLWLLSLLVSFTSAPSSYISFLTLSLSISACFSSLSFSAIIPVRFSPTVRALSSCRSFLICFFAEI